MTATAGSNELMPRIRTAVTACLAKAQEVSERAGVLKSVAARLVAEARRLRRDRVAELDARAVSTRRPNGEAVDVLWLPRDGRELEPVASCPRCRVPLVGFPRQTSQLLVCRTCGFVSRHLTPESMARAQRAMARVWAQQRKEKRHAPRGSRESVGDD